MKKYLYAILFSFLVTIVFGTIFNYFGYDGKFLTGWFACTAYFITLDYHNARGN